MTEGIEEQLRDFDLSQSEIRVYLYLLKSGYSTPPKIAQGTGIARTNTYNVLQKLKDKHLVLEQEKRNKKIYFATDPDALVAYQKRKTRAVELLLPALRGLYGVQKNKPMIRYYDGFDEIKHIWEEMVKAKKIYGIASTHKLFKLDPKFFVDFRDKLKRNSVEFYDIITAPSEEKAMNEVIRDLGDLYKVKVLSAKFGDFATDVLIWDKNIALVTTEEPVFATVLTDVNLANSFLMIFSALWESLPNPKVFI